MPVVGPARRRVDVFTRFRAVFRLMTGPVMAGLLPVITCHGIWSDVKAATTPRRGRIPPPTTFNVWETVLFVLLSLLALWMFRRMLRRARSAEDGTYYELSRSSWIGLLWVGFAAGLACGVMMFVDTR